jgi:hypothetical protein
VESILERLALLFETGAVAVPPEPPAHPGLVVGTTDRGRQDELLRRRFSELCQETRQLRRRATQVVQQARETLQGRPQ